MRDEKQKNRNERKNVKDEREKLGRRRVRDVGEERKNVGDETEMRETRSRNVGDDMRHITKLRQL